NRRDERDRRYERAESRKRSKGYSDREICDRHGNGNRSFRSNQPRNDERAGLRERPKRSDDREIPDLDWGGNGSLRSTDRQCDTEREAAGGAAQERNEGGWREDIAQCYSGNRGIGKCSSISCSVGECSAISCDR